VAPEPEVSRETAEEDATRPWRGGQEVLAFRPRRGASMHTEDDRSPAVRPRGSCALTVEAPTCSRASCQRSSCASPFRSCKPNRSCMNELAVRSMKLRGPPRARRLRSKASPFGGACDQPARPKIQSPGREREENAASPSICVVGAPNTFAAEARVHRPFIRTRTPARPCSDPIAKLIRTTCRRSASGAPRLVYPCGNKVSGYRRRSAEHERQAARKGSG